MQVKIPELLVPALATVVLVVVFVGFVDGVKTVHLLLKVAIVLGLALAEMVASAVAAPTVHAIPVAVAVVVPFVAPVGAVGVF